MNIENYHYFQSRDEMTGELPVSNPSEQLVNYLLNQHHPPDFCHGVEITTLSSKTVVPSCSIGGKSHAQQWREDNPKYNEAEVIKLIPGMVYIQRFQMGSGAYIDENVIHGVEIEPGRPKPDGIKCK